MFLLQWLDITFATILLTLIIFKKVFFFRGMLALQHHLSKYVLIIPYLYLRIVLHKFKTQLMFIVLRTRLLIRKFIFAVTTFAGKYSVQDVIEWVLLL